MKKKNIDMTSGPIFRQLVLFALPLVFGNAFQMLYNTVDTWVVGNFVGTEALAAVGSTTMIVNIMVFFFNGLSLGGGVVISHCFGAKDYDRLHIAVETTMALTFVMGILSTIVGIIFVKPMLVFMSTPDDVMADAALYLRIYFAGMMGLMIYNMGSGILRAVGDTKRPLYFLILTSVLNIILDLFFVIVCHMGIAGVGLATVLSQIVSAVLVLRLLTHTTEFYRFAWKDLRFHKKTLMDIISIGIPQAIQSTLTAFSNVFVQSYVNSFGSSVMAGWSCYNKIDSFIMLPMSSVAQAATTFVGQNMGANEEKRADKGTLASITLTVSITALLALPIYIFAGPATAIFSDDEAVIEFGKLFLRNNTWFLLFNCVNHVLAGALRGRGESKAPMFIMLGSFVGLRQIYLILATKLIANTPTVVGYGYPVGWTACFLVEVAYYFLSRKFRKNKEIKKLG